MKAYEGSGDVALCILNLDIRWERVLLSHLSSGRKSLQYTVTSSMGGREVVNSRDILMRIQICWDIMLSVGKYRLALRNIPEDLELSVTPLLESQILKIKIIIFWDVMAYHLVGGYQSF
jgi:hypothetical protein